MKNLHFAYLAKNRSVTVKHLLISCVEFGNIRVKYFNAKTIKELFNDSSNDKIIHFLKEIKLFNKL